VPTRRTRGREMKVKIIPIMLLLLFSMATPVAVSMAIPKDTEPFVFVARLEPLEPTILNPDKKGVQKYHQDGVLYDIDNDEVGEIHLYVSIMNFYKAWDGAFARARVHFIMDFDNRAEIRGIIVGKIWIENEVQYADGIFVGRGSHVKGKISYLDPGDPDVLLFEGEEW